MVVEGEDRSDTASSLKRRSSPGGDVHEWWDCLCGFAYDSPVRLRHPPLHARCPKRKKAGEASPMVKRKATR